jgi:hypothetical protein
MYAGAGTEVDGGTGKHPIPTHGHAPHTNQVESALAEGEQEAAQGAQVQHGHQQQHALHVGLHPGVKPHPPVLQDAPQR